MDINDLRSIVTVVSLFTFLGIIWFAYTKSNKDRFDEAAQLPFADDEAERAETGTDSARNEQRKKS